MEEDKGSAPVQDEPDVSELLRENEALREKLRGYEEREEQVRKAGKKLGRAAAELAVGKEILPASRELVAAVNQNLQGRKLEIPEEESAELVAAVLRRLLRVRAWAIGFALVGLVVATVPPFLQWQSNKLLREQIQVSNANSRAQALLFQKQLQQQATDTEIVRRAQLIDIIYAEDCPGEPSEDCVPRANLRAREEAVLAFLTIERARGVEQPDLRGADLRGANLLDADLRGADLRLANLRDATLRGVDRSNVGLLGVHLRDAILRDVIFIDAGLIDVFLLGADLRGAILLGADLRDADLRGAILRGAILLGADLRGTGLRGADLSDAILLGADLRGAILLGADLSDAILLGADLRGADLRGADLSKVMGLTQEQLNSTAKGDEDTKLPDSFIAPPHWFQEDTTPPPDTPDQEE